MTPATSPIGVEALDDPATDPVLVRRMLHDIALANRWFGGRAPVHAGLAELIGTADRGRTLTLFDIGTGAADLPRDAVRWAARRGVHLLPLGLERSRAAAAVARAAGIPVMLGCASAVPVADHSVDIVLVSQLAHHLDHDAVASLFERCSRIARRGVIVADLRPSAVYAAAFRVGAILLGMHPVTRHDGVTSIARGFSVATMRSLAGRAGARGARVRSLPFARVVASWRTDR